MSEDGLGSMAVITRASKATALRSFEGSAAGPQRLVPAAIGRGGLELWMAA